MKRLQKRNVTMERFKIKCNPKIPEILLVFLVGCELGHFGNSIAEYTILGMMLLYLGIDILYHHGSLLGMRRLHSKYLSMLALFSIFSLLSIIWTDSIDAYADAAPSIVKCLFITLWIFSFANSEGSILQMVNCYLIGVSYMCLRIILYLPFAGGFRYGLGDTITRPATGMQFNMAAQIAAFAFIIAFFLYLRQRRKIYLAMVPLSITVIFVTGSRKAMLMPIVGILLIYFLQIDMKINRKKLLKFIGVSILIAAATVVVIRSNKELNARMLALYNSMILGDDFDGSYVLRQLMIKKAKHLFMSKPLVGWGLNDFAYNAYGNSWSIHLAGRYAHNNYWELLSCIGIVGFILYYSRYLLVFKKYFKNRNKSTYIDICFIVFITLAVFEYGIVSYNIMPLQIMLALMVPLCSDYSERKGL